MISLDFVTGKVHKFAMLIFLKNSTFLIQGAILNIKSPDVLQPSLASVASLILLFNS